MFNKARQANKVERLHGDTRGSYAESYHATREADKRRKALLKDARRLSPIDTVLRLNKLGQTVLGRLLTHSVTWIVIATYAATATCSHYGYLPFTEEELTDRDSFEGSGTLITFMIVFYVGYCYNRYSNMFSDLEVCMRQIVNCCSIARVEFKDSAALYDLWRFLNLLHVTAYCGCTATYNKANLCEEFCRQHGLLTDPSVRERLEEIDVESPVAWSTCMVWALEVVHMRADAKDFSSPIHSVLVGSIAEIGSALSRIYAQEYQVLPYIYTHLVSFACTVYLVALAFLKGLSFREDASPIFGLVLPGLSMLLLTCTYLGLLLIGNLLANPLGPNRESFAVCHFLNYTCTCSLEAVSVDRAPTLTRTFTQADPKEAPLPGAGVGMAALDPEAVKKVKEMIAEERKELEKLMIQSATARLSHRAARTAASSFGGGAPASGPTAAPRASPARWTGLRKQMVDDAPSAAGQAASKLKVSWADVGSSMARATRRAKEADNEDAAPRRLTQMEMRDEAIQKQESALRVRLSARQQLLQELESTGPQPLDYGALKRSYTASATAPERGDSSTSLFDATRESSSFSRHSRVGSVLGVGARSNLSPAILRRSGSKSRVQPTP